MSATPDREQAQELLSRAGQLGTAATSGAGWPQLAMLLGLGAVSSMFVILMGTGAGRDIYLPVMFTMFAWVAILIVTGVVFSRSSKAGFGKRWATTMFAWGILWGVAILIGPNFFAGQPWFFITMAALITAVTTAGTWIEARK
jgi:hypothetical protein